MKKNAFSLKFAYLATSLIMLFMLFLQFMLLRAGDIHEAQTATGAYLSQVDTILTKNSQQEEALLRSLKEEYTVLAKAVAYYLDHNEAAISDTEELQKIASLMSIDEIHVFDEEGRIFSSSVPHYIGYTFDSGEQIAYFKPMLTDRTLSMCQDMAPNTAEGKFMVYAITWNEEQTFMVQVGIEPTRLLSELSSNEIPNVVNHIPLTEDMSLLITPTDHDLILGATSEEFTYQNLSEVSDLDLASLQEDTPVFLSKCRLGKETGSYFCAAKKGEKYCIFIFLSHHYFFSRAMQSLLLVALYLLFGFAVIVIIIWRLFHSRRENIQHMQVFQSMSEIYYSLHLVDLKENTVIVYSAKNQVKDSYQNSKHEGADQVMVNIMHATMSDEYLERGLEFTDLNTLPQRMKDKKIISMELLGKNVGWIRMSFITITAHEGLPRQIVVATQIIDEEKKRAQSLYEKSYMDELTKCFNRRAYNNDLLTYLDRSTNSPFVYISMDVNGLKTVNDTLGHEAGDELILGASSCMNQIFGDHGKVYRVGGDEFVALLFVDGRLMETLSQRFDQLLKSWHGNLVDKIAVSYGYVLSDEVPGQSMTEISSLADKRMYENKTRYYQEMGISQRRT